MQVKREWVEAITESVSKHFYVNRDNLYMYLPGRKDERDKKSDWFELRFIGPEFKNPSTGVWNVELEVDVVVQGSVDRGEFRNPFVASDLAGQVSEMFTCIGIFSGEEYLGALDLDPDGVMIGPIMNIEGQPHQRTTVLGIYRMQIIE